MTDLDDQIHRTLRQEHVSIFRGRVTNLILSIVVALLAFMVIENMQSISQLQGYVKTACQPVNDNPTTKNGASSGTRDVCDKAQANRLPGPMGPQGPAGANGRDGANGADGRDGLPGVSGSPGATGSKGPKGDQGQAGSKGATGNTGPKGADGANGADGKVGPSGAPGPSGKDGKDGLDGPAGPTGPPGPSGPSGPAGKDGKDGSDGRGVSSWDCAGGHWVVTYTDGTSETTNGLCVAG